MTDTDNSSTQINVTHSSGVKNPEELSFATPFGYMFPDYAKSAEYLLPTGQSTTRGLLELGHAMAGTKQETAASGSKGTSFEQSAKSSILTYFGQFIDHDITARTDRETALSEIFAPDGGALPIQPVDPDMVVQSLRNGRRPQLDLDSVYGSGPNLVGSGVPGSEPELPALFDDNKLFKLQKLNEGAVDLPRNRDPNNPRAAILGDMRNDENINVSQLHAAFLAFHNKLAEELSFSEARQLVRWTYQFLVVAGYLKEVCLKSVVDDVLCNGPIHYGPVSAGEATFMPLEFSVAAFRFGHSMVRPEYELRGGPVSINHILGVSHHRDGKIGSEDEALLDPNKNDNKYQLKEKFTVDWSRFLGDKPVNKAGKIDPMIAKGLGDLTFEPMRGTVMAHLAQRNLLRGFLLSIPTGQALARACGVKPMTSAEILNGENGAIVDVLKRNKFDEHTPAWYYILREARVQTEGESLGLVGSRIVAETIIGLLKKDPNSYLNACGNPCLNNGIITDRGITMPTSKVIGSFTDFLEYGEVYVPQAEGMAGGG